MLRLQQIKCPIPHDQKYLEHKICRILGISADRLISCRIVRRSVDARKKPELFYVYTVDCTVANENRLRKKADGRTILLHEETLYRFPAEGECPLSARPVIVGSGPAGLFCAYMLASHGYRPLILERGDEVFRRREKVEHFWNTGTLDIQSNVQFGEGGAGTFSDGKLNTSVKDPVGRNRLVLETFVRFGAPPSIVYDQKPHLGTDILIDIVKAMREETERLGGEFLFRHQLTGLEVRNGCLVGILVNNNEYIPTKILVTAIGHSARDTFAMLYGHGLAMAAKSFAVGVRIEHPQSMINLSQYGRSDPGDVGAAPYKVTHKLENGRGVYSFCMCPGGYVVNASSEPGRLAVNGMSYHARDSRNANSALIVTVNPDDYLAYGSAGTPVALRGMAFQRELEEHAFALAGGHIPVQLFGDFCENRSSVMLGDVEPCIKGAWSFANLRSILPEPIGSSIEQGIKAFDCPIHGFGRPDSLLSGIESRTSSPVRIERTEKTLESNIAGVYPCGEGAGYAGGITSAAMDGIRVAEAIRRRYRASHITGRNS